MASEKVIEKSRSKLSTVSALAGKRETTVLNLKQYVQTGHNIRLDLFSRLLGWAGYF